ncbi:hypothetical protein CFC21_091397 [Triticum aestivum]|uniref:F-box protein AT5G49610-like beta-propeller domain-containing protein n=2 Tax=Triticum aestivum TaxID=4565 RepID=A0A9R1MT22_WHEAT|nr:uncharacterized protein LOC123143428 isoform X2 [Triticum aestivum]KAF7088272.1 hypothetical protein CFC21_091397 [Triticum aestivum]
MSCEEMSRRPLPPAAAPPLEDDNLLSEILLRLSPDPSSLPRASLISKRWLGIVSDPGFSRRFRLHHRHNPPLLGFFYHVSDFEPAMDPPNRVPDSHLSSCLETLDDDRIWYLMPLGSRHGLLLTFCELWNKLLVWDTFNVEQHHLAVPPGFDLEKAWASGAVFRAAGDNQYFQVVLVSTETADQQHTRAIARVYSSETGGWGDIVSTPLPPKASSSTMGEGEFPTKITMFLTISVLVGHSIYWLLIDRSAEINTLDGILEFDLERQILAVIPVPLDIANNSLAQFQVMRAEGGGLGILSLSKFSAQLWKMETDSDGVASWMLQRTINLDKLLSTNSDIERGPPPIILGFAEYNNVVFLWTHIGVFTIQLESLTFKKVSKTLMGRYFPFESGYAAGGKRIGGGHDGAELLHNT